MAVAGDDGPGVRVVRDGSEDDFASGGFDEELTCGDVPERDARFDIGVEPAAGDVGHAEGGGAHHAHFPSAEGRLVEAFDSGAEGFLVFAAADEEDGLIEGVAFAGVDWAAIEEGGAAFCDGPGFADHGVMDDADGDFTGDAQGDGDAEMGDAVEKIHGSVDRVDDPLAG